MTRRRNRFIVRCGRKGCVRRVPPKALKYGDPYCSRPCAEKALGTREKNQRWFASIRAMYDRGEGRGDFLPVGGIRE